MSSVTIDFNTIEIHNEIHNENTQFNSVFRPDVNLCFSVTEINDKMSIFSDIFICPEIKYFGVFFNYA